MFINSLPATGSWKGNSNGGRVANKAAYSGSGVAYLMLGEFDMLVIVVAADGVLLSLISG